MEESLKLLQDAIQEIKVLRKSNELMKVRLDMFDTINMMLHTQVPGRGECMSPDVVREIEKFFHENKLKES